MGVRERHIKCWLEVRWKKNRFEDVGMDWRMILKWILSTRTRGRGLDFSVSRQAANSYKVDIGHLGFILYEKSFYYLKT
jgi:hypothetical protein